MELGSQQRFPLMGHAAVIFELCRRWHHVLQLVATLSFSLRSRNKWRSQRILKLGS